MRTNIARRRRVLAAASLLLLAACSPSTSAAPSGPPGSSSGAPIATRPIGTGVASGPTATGAAPRPATTTDLIEAALAKGTIDAPTALLDRIYAYVGDSRLPAEFTAGAPSTDDAALVEAGAVLETLPPAIRDEILPFTLRPTDPASPWSGAAAVTGAQEGASFDPNVNTCRPDGWDEVPGQGPYNVWVRCGPGAETRAKNVAALLDGLWGPMTGLMGAPIPDEDVSGKPGDGRMDVYLTNGCVTRGGKCTRISTGAVAVANRSAPYVEVGPAWKSSGFVVLSGDASISLDELKHDLAHEFFHVLEYAHNTFAPFGAPAGWFGEASSTWAESHFTKLEAAEDTNLWFSEYQATSNSLQQVTGDNAYASFMWPFFMEQERGASSVAAAWVALEGQVSVADMNQAIDSALPFQEGFRDFAVRALNQTLSAGDPIEPRFSALDAAVSDATPGGTRLRPKIELIAQLNKTVVNEHLPSLWASYTDITVDPTIGTLKLAFDGLSPSDALDVDVLLKVKDKGWERRKLTNGETTLCLNRPEDAAQEIWLVLSNHDPDLAHAIDGSYSMTSVADLCSPGHYSIDVANVGTGKGKGVGHHEGDGQVVCTLNSNGLWAASGVYFANDPDGAGRDIAMFEIDPATGNEWASMTLMDHTSDNPYDWSVMSTFQGKLAFSSTDTGDAVTVSVVASDKAQSIKMTVSCSVIQRG